MHKAAETDEDAYMLIQRGDSVISVQGLKRVRAGEQVFQSDTTLESSMRSVKTCVWLAWSSPRVGQLQHDQAAVLQVCLQLTSASGLLRMWPRRLELFVASDATSKTRFPTER